MTATLDPSSDELISLSVLATDATVRVCASGEVDSTSAPRLQAELDAQLDTGVRELVVDLDAVTFLDSAGLCALAATHRRATNQGVVLRVLVSHRAVIRPLQITGLYDLLGVEQSS